MSSIFGTDSCTNDLPCLQHLESVIRARIPSITSFINKTIDELESEMDHLGRPIAVDAGVSFFHLIHL